MPDVLALDRHIQCGRSRSAPPENQPSHRREMCDVEVMVMPDVLPAGALELRRCRTSHLVELMTAIAASRPGLTRWLPWADPWPTEEAELEFLRAHEQAFDRDEDYGYFLFERDSGELVGGIGLHPNEENTAEIGYWVRSDRIGRGYATAAAGALTSAAFLCLTTIDRVIIRMDQANHASAVIPPKLDFALHGEDVSRRVPTVDRSGKGWIWARRRSAG